MSGGVPLKFNYPYCCTCLETDITKLLKNNVSHLKDGTIRQHYRCRKCNAKRVRNYSQTPTGYRNRNDGLKRFLERNPIKARAYKMVRSAIRNGTLQKPSACTNCGAVTKIHGHHRDYSKPLEVLWLCQTCHADEHRKLNGVNQVSAF